MHISFFLLVPLISLSIMLVTPNLNFHLNAIAMKDGHAEVNGFYNNYENGGINSKYSINTNEFERFENHKLVVKAKIYLQNLERVGFLRISSLLNGEEIINDIPLSEIDRSIPTITIDLVVNKKNDIVETSANDEYHVCAYHIRDLKQEYDSFTNFDCNEGDLLSVGMPN